MMTTTAATLELATFGRGDWMETVSGRKFHPFDPRPEDLDIEEIAHALSLVCRFGGQVNDFYSVAQHSVLVSQVCDPEDALAGLLHDAAEAYIGDMIRPLKWSGWFPNYDRVEKMIMAAVAERFGIPEQMPASVKRADDILVVTERRDLRVQSGLEWNVDARPLPYRIEPLFWRHAKIQFLDRFHELYGKE